MQFYMPMYEAIYFKPNMPNMKIDDASSLNSLPVCLTQEEWNKPSAILEIFSNAFSWKKMFVSE